MSIQQLNLKELQRLLASKNALWQAGETSNAQLPDDQKEKNLGYVPGPREPSLRERENIALANLSAAKTEGFSVSAIPAVFDWRNHNGNNYVTPIRNQGGCGSCVAFGSIANMETTYQILKNNPRTRIDFSEAQLFYCYARSQGRVCGFHNESNAGWWVGPAMDSLKQGIADESCYPYDGSMDQNCTHLCSDSASRSKKISGWHAITNINDMKTWIATKGPLTTCFTVYSITINPVFITTPPEQQLEGIVSALLVTATPETATGSVRTVGAPAGEKAAIFVLVTERPE